MSKKKEEVKMDEVTFLTSLALAVPVDEQVKHVQIVLVRVNGTDAIRCFMDVIDPTKLPKFQEDEK